MGRGNSRRVEQRRARVLGRVSRLGIEALEERVLLANLHIVDAYFSDSEGNKIETPAYGALAYLQADFQTNSLPVGAKYDVRFTLADQVVFIAEDRTAGAGEAGIGNRIIRRGPFLVRDPADNYKIELDINNEVAETSEADNIDDDTYNAVSFSPGFQRPLEGTEWADWSISNYVDVDGNSGGGFGGPCDDYRGGNFCYDGHNGWDIGVTNWKEGYAGVDVYAAAAGTVIERQDGNYDHNEEALGQESNYVKIQHVGGFQTIYHHLRRDSVTVLVGDTVAAGEKIGLMGSSGNSTALHLHWAVYRDNLLIEPMVAPSAYLNYPLGYSGDNPTILGIGVTSYAPNGELSEGPPTSAVFSPTGFNQNVFSWATIGGHLGDKLTTKWIRPNGTIAETDSFFPNSNGIWFQGFVLTPTAPKGTWTVAWEVNDVEKKRTTFRYQDTPEPQARMYTSDNEYIADTRTTPFDLGFVIRNQLNTTPRFTFNVRNDGRATLNTSFFSLPEGFSVPLFGGLDPTIAAGASDNVTIAVDNDTLGHKQGFVSFRTDDPDVSETLQSFAIEADVLRADAAVDRLFSDEDDELYLRKNTDGNVEIFVNRALSEAPNWTIPFSEMASFSINTGGGNDTVTLDAVRGTPIHLLSTSFNGGDGLDTLIVLGEAGADAFTISNSGVGFDSSRMSYSNLERLEVDGRNGDDEFTIGAGSTRDLEMTGATVTVIGGGGDDAVSISDQDGTAGTYFLQADRLVKRSSPTVNYEDIESLEFRSSEGEDTVSVDSTPAGAQVTVRGGAGDDELSVSTSSSTVTLEAGQGADVLEVRGHSAFASVVVEPSVGLDALEVNSDGVGFATVRLEETIQFSALNLHEGARVLLADGPFTIRTPVLSLAGSARMDLNDGALIWSNGSISQMRSWISAGRGTAGGGVANGAWNGQTGITSSAAQAAFSEGGSETRSLGYALNGELLVSYAVFRGFAVTEEDVLVRFTKNADANLDGVVNNNDITILAGFYRPGQGGKHWHQADFNYDGQTNNNDITILAGFYRPNEAPVNAEAEEVGGLQLAVGGTEREEARVVYSAKVESGVERTGFFDEEEKNE